MFSLLPNLVFLTLSVIHVLCSVELFVIRVLCFVELFVIHVLCFVELFVIRCQILASVLKQGEPQAVASIKRPNLPKLPQWSV